MAEQCDHCYYVNMIMMMDIMMNMMMMMKVMMMTTTMMMMMMMMMPIYTVDMGEERDEHPANISHLYQRQHLNIHNHHRMITLIIIIIG